MSSSSEEEVISKKKSSTTQLSVERIYQKKSQLEHILLRPDSYIGSVQPVTESMFVLENDVIISKEITFVPGLYKIFDEILVNAADNKQRDPNMDTIRISISPEKNEIVIYNNGRGIPVVKHKEENMFVPTMIFGHLLTSSNFNDEEEKVTGGRNGYGAKLCNVFSTKFILETACKQYNKEFKQVWSNNMSKVEEPSVIPMTKSSDFTRVTFRPDLAKFHMGSLDSDTVSLLSRRAYDIAASTKGVKVFLNGTRIPVKGFKDYVDFFLKDKEDEGGTSIKAIYEACNPRWEIAVAVSDKGFQQMSFVNSIATTKGGRHVDYITEMLTKKLSETIAKKNKGGLAIKPFQIKNHLYVFVNCLIVNPTFDSQTKENMTLQVKNFGSKCLLGDKFLASVNKSGIVEAVLSWSKFKQDQQKSKTSGKKTSKLKGIPKLEDANDAGTKNSIDCTLILTEGDSAKTLAVSGLSVVGRDKYGVFPLRGKLLNVREATHKQLLENKEINELVKIMGLTYKKKYSSLEDLKSLRYGRMMIMTDQDQDGSHIKGLLINFIHHNWPSLLQLPFLEEFITPIVKATKGDSSLSFYSLPEFNEWKSGTDNWHLYKIKYYKGLGTSTSKEAKEYFIDMNRHRILFDYNGASDDHSITMAFSKKCIEERKDWLSNWMAEGKRRKEIGLGEIYLYEKNTKSVSYSDFVNKELVLFSNLDNERSIPNLVDGFKPGQRKVMFTCLKRNDKREIKVAQLAGSVGEMSAYHHGEASLMGTIINLAQNYVGSNNINLLMPIGQFGTRLAGGKDHASPRYIFTKLSPLTRHIFNVNDDAILNYLKDDNLSVEPDFYVPIIPMVLVNGADGIGTGWMTKIPNFNPRDIIDNIKRLLDGESLREMIPWFKDFRGTIVSLGEQKYAISGEISHLDNTRVEITELPIRTWTQNYKESVMEVLLNGTEKTPGNLITDYKEYHTDLTVKFVVSMTSDKLRDVEIKSGLHTFFKLQTTLSTSSMVLFDHMGVLRKYECPLDIMRDFYELRLKYYGLRKKYMVGMLEAESGKLSNQARFILEKCDGKLIVENKKKKILEAELYKAGYDSDPVKEWKKSIQKEEEIEVEDDEDEDGNETRTSNKSDSSDYDYLLTMQILSLTKERKDELLKRRDDKLKELEKLRKITEKDMWRSDLESLLSKLNEVEENERLDILKVKVGKGGGSKNNNKVKPSDFKPSHSGIRVEPKIGDELRAKVSAAAKAKANKVLKQKTTSTPKSGGDAEDEFDEMLSGQTKKSLAERLNVQSKKLPKQRNGKEKKKKNPWVSDDDDEEEDDENDESPCHLKKNNDDDDDDDNGEHEILERRNSIKRNNSGNKKYSQSSSSSSGDENDTKNNSSSHSSPVKEKIKSKKKVIIDDDDDDDFVLNSSKDDDKEFDAILSKKITGGPRRKLLPLASDEDGPSKKKKKAPFKTAAFSKGAARPKEKKSKVQKMNSSSENEFPLGDFESQNIKERRPGRSKKPIAFNFEDSDSD